MDQTNVSELLPLIRAASKEKASKDDRIIHVAARFGYMDQTSVPDLLPLMHGSGMGDPSTTTGCRTSSRGSSSSRATRRT